MSISVNTFNTSKIEEDKLLEIIKEVFKFKPKEIIKELRYNNLYELSSYGQVRVLIDKLPWEKVNKVELLKHLVNDY